MEGSSYILVRFRSRSNPVLELRQGGCAFIESLDLSKQLLPHQNSLFECLREIRLDCPAQPASIAPRAYSDAPCPDARRPRARARTRRFAEGLTLDEMAEAVKVSRRTAERMRDAVEAAFGPLDIIEDGRKRRFRSRRAASRRSRPCRRPRSSPRLENAARALEPAPRARPCGAPAFAEGQDRRVLARSRPAAACRGRRRRGSSLRREAFACRVGPRPLADPAILRDLRQALLAGRMVKFDYGNPPRGRNRIPWGILFGPRAYLISQMKGQPPRPVPPR